MSIARVGGFVPVNLSVFPWWATVAAAFEWGGAHPVTAAESFVSPCPSLPLANVNTAELATAALSARALGTWRQARWLANHLQDGQLWVVYYSQLSASLLPASSQAAMELIYSLLTQKQKLDLHWESVESEVFLEWADYTMCSLGESRIPLIISMEGVVFSQWTNYRSLLQRQYIWRHSDVATSSSTSTRRHGDDVVTSVWCQMRNSWPAEVWT